MRGRGVEASKTLFLLFFLYVEKVMPKTLKYYGSIEFNIKISSVCYGIYANRIRTSYEDK